MAFTVAKRILEKEFPNSVNIGINAADFEYHEPVVKHRDPIEAQPIVVSAKADVEKGKSIPNSMIPPKIYGIAMRLYSIKIPRLGC